ncbi:MAG: NHLP bacteriocin system secretion protein [Deferribacterales bacterium]
MSEIFRRKSLEKLASPDKLDELMLVTDAKGWLALLALGLIIALAVFWGFFSTIPEKVDGLGIFLRPEGLADVIAPSTGQVKDIYVSTGDIIKKGYPVARINQMELLAEIKDLRSVINDLKFNLENLKKAETQSVSMKQSMSTQRKVAIHEKVLNLRKQEAWLKQKIENQKKLYDDGLITWQTLIDSQSNLDSVRQQISDAESSRSQDEMELHERFGQKDKQVEDLNTQIAQKERELEKQLLALDNSSKIISPYNGRIVELNVDRDSMVSKGSPIARIEISDDSIKNLEAVMYFPPMQGKKVKPGMRVNISPSTVKQEEYGFIVGIVTFVSEFPVSSSAMESTLHNDSLAQNFTQSGAPVEIRADLIPDPSTPSGFKWSSRKGPDITIETGTLCTASVAVSEQKPINLVVPLFKKYVLGR